MPTVLGMTGRSVCLGAMLTALGGQAAFAQNGSCADDAIIVFDGSGSMSELAYNPLREPRIVDVRRAMHRVIPEVAPVRRLGLMIYGPGARDVCSNVHLRFAPTPDAADRILGDIDAVRPAGQTPLTRAVAEAAAALGAPERAGLVVLVTDGQENCDGSPCQLAASLAQQAPSITVHVIGFRMRSDFFDWPGGAREVSRSGADSGMTRCLAERTGGMYVSTETVDELTEALKQTLSCMVIGRGDGVPAPPSA